jgi:hypothetical protein
MVAKKVRTTADKATMVKSETRISTGRELIKYISAGREIRLKVL